MGENIRKMGFTEENNKEIICCVNRNRIKTYRKLVNSYSMKPFTSKKIYGRYEINLEKSEKPVTYIFDKINFDSGLKLDSEADIVVFKDCIFNKDIIINKGQYVVFINNVCDIRRFSACNVENLMLNGECIKNSNIRILANELYIDKTTLDCNDYNMIQFENKYLSIKDSTIDTNNLNINSDDVKIDQRTLINANQITIENKNNNFDCFVTSNYIAYNGLDLSNSGIDIINQDIYELVEKRNSLVKTLQKLNLKCEEKCNKEFQKIKKKEIKNFLK